MQKSPLSTAERRARLMEAEGRGMALFDAIERAEIIRPGRTEQEVDADIFSLAHAQFGVEKHWHRRVVRAGVNTLCTFYDKAPVATIAEDDIVYLDLGPVFETDGEWEADIGRSYVVGNDPHKRRLVADLSRAFDIVQARYRATPDIAGDALYAFARKTAEGLGWEFGGVIAGHIVGEFPHAQIPGDKDLARISPKNPRPMNEPDALGQERFWILEIHLVDRAKKIGGFYERLLQARA